MRERAIEAKLRREVLKVGGLCIKLPSSLYNGIPDRMVLLPGGRVFFIELKTKHGRASLWQKRWRIILQKMGFNSTIIKGIEALEEFINEHVQRSI